MTLSVKSLFSTGLVAGALLLTGCDSTSNAPALTWDAPEAKQSFSEDGAPYLSGAKARSMRTHYGPARPLGNGVTRTFVTFNAQGAPNGLGVMLSEKALDNLPQHGSHDEHMLALRWPVQASGLFADHVSVDWNPHGHEPEGLFTVPHFDLHFYTATEPERATWTPADPQYEAKLALAPDAQYVPAGFMQLPGGVPMMGAHWIDLSDPTYAPGGPAFTEVLLWGSYNGAVAFIEPMITTAFLQTRPQFAETLVQPAAVQKTGYYPATYTIRHDAQRKAYVIALQDLVLRQAS